MLKNTFLLFIFNVLLSTNLLADSIYFKFLPLPQKHFIPVFTADTRAHQTGMLYFSEKNQKHFTGCVGSVFPLFKIKSKYFTAQLSIAASVYNELILNKKAVYTVNNDYLVDWFFDIAITRKINARLGTGHTSHHLTDDAILKNLRSKILNYVKDYYLSGVVYANENEMIYGIAYYFYNFKATGNEGLRNFNGLTMFQGGFEKNIFKLNKDVNFFGACDVKFRQEFNFGSTQNIQLGVKWKNENHRNIRYVLNFTSGYEERGQFYTNKRNYFHTGFLFNF